MENNYTVIHVCSITINDTGLLENIISTVNPFTWINNQSDIGWFIVDSNSNVDSASVNLNQYVLSIS